MELTRYFESRTRDNGEQFVTLADDRPEWLHDAVMAAHDGELPNDWRYETCRDICSWIDDQEADSTDLDDSAFEIADSLTDQNTYDLISWVGGDLSRVSYCDDAASEAGLNEASGQDQGLIRRITLGQFECIRQMANEIITAVMEAEDAGQLGGES